MKLIPVDNQIEELTEADKKLVLRVFEQTAVTAPGEQRPGIVTFKGRESFDTFKGVKGVKTGSWNKMPPLGREGLLHPEGRGGRPKRCKRLIERHFENSLLWPEGIPIGILLEHRQQPDGTWKKENSKMDISMAEYQRLATFAQGLIPLTERQIKADAIRKDNLRSMSGSAEGKEAALLLQKVLATNLVRADAAEKDAELEALKS